MGHTEAAGPLVANTEPESPCLQAWGRLLTLSIPLREDPPGVLRVGKSQVFLELAIQAHQQGRSLQELVAMYNALDLGDVYAVIA